MWYSFTNKAMNMNFLLTIFSSIVLLSSGGDRLLLSEIDVLHAEVLSVRDPIVPEFQRTRNSITVMVYTYDTVDELNESWEERTRNDNITFKTVLGWAEWNNGDPPYWCNIHVIEVDRVYDAELNIWGHELAHCLYGNFHN